MRYFLLFIFGLAAYTCAIAQTPQLGGVVNVYSRITAINTCTNSISLSQTSGFNVGMGVLILQMQGADMTDSDNASFGNITALNGAGLYEYNRIVAIEGQTLTLERIIQAGYQPEHSLQCVGFAIHAQASITDTLRAAAWDGEKGGVVAIEAIDTLYIYAPIDASGVGFRGGNSVQATDINCSVITINNRYYYENGNWRGAPKGEGITRGIIGKELGRGPQANGGGGGNNHNSGGGGGAQASRGGRGGENNEPSFGGCDGFFPGEGGKTAASDPNRIWMGGGGGAGHRNNDASTVGGAGGGIVFIKATVIISDGGQIGANGQPGASLQGDGGGGGGAGGVVLLFADAAHGSLPIRAEGGAGGSINNGNQERCMGPGGGGSGGRLLSNLSLSASLNGGSAGQSFNSASCSVGTNGAQNGQAGISQNATWVSGAPYTAPALMSTVADVLLCAGETASLGAVVQGSNISLQWQYDAASTGNFINLAEGPLYNGVDTDTLQLLPGASAGTYRLVLSSAQQCFPSITSAPFVVAYVPQLVADFSTTATQLNVQLLNNSTADQGTQYFWDFGDGTTSILAQPTHTYAQGGTHTISLTVSNDCGSATATQTLTLGVAPSALIGTTPSSACFTGPRTVLFENLSTGVYDQQMWTFPGGTPASSSAPSVTVSYPTNGTYTAMLVISGPFGSSSSTAVVSWPPIPVPDFSFEANGLQVSFINESENATQYNWDFGDGATSTLENPVHTYAAAGTYQVTLNAQLGDCGVASVRQVQITSTATTEPHAATVWVYPNPAQDWVILAGATPALVSLYNSQGQHIQTWEVHLPQHRLALPTVPRGYYCLRIQSQTGYLAIPLVIQR